MGATDHDVLHLREELLDWQRFLVSDGHILQQWPDLIWQQAANQPKESLVSCRTATAREAGRWADRSWLECITRPKRRSQLVATLAGHVGSVQAVAASPDGCWIVSGSTDNTLRFWDARSGQELRMVSLRPHEIWAVAVSPDGGRILWAGRDPILGTLDSATGCELRRIELSSGQAHAIAIMPDGLHFVTANDDGTVAIREMNSSALVRSWNAHAPWGASAVAMTPCGTRIISCGGDGIKLWDAQTGRKLQSFHEQAGSVRALAMMPDGTRIVCGNSNATITVLDIRSGCTLASMNVLEALQAHGIARPPGQPPMVCAVAVTRDGRRVLSGGYDNTVWIWDIESGKALSGLSGHGHWIWGLAQTPDGLIVSASADGTLRFWAPRDTPDNDGPSGRSDMSCLLSSDAGMLVTGTEGGMIRVRNAESGEPMREWQAHNDEGVMSLAMTVDSRAIVSGGTLGSVQVWDAQTGLKLRSLAQGRKLQAGSRWYEKNRFVERMRITPEGYAVAVGKSLKAWNLFTGRRVWLSDTVGREEGLLGGRYVLQERNEGVSLARVLRRGVGNSALIEIPLSRQLSTAPVALSPDGRRVVLRGSEECVEVWDIAKRAKLATLAEPARVWRDPDPAGDRLAVAGTTEIQVSPDNRRIFTAGDRVVRAWDSQSFELLWTTHAGPGICCSPDGSHLLAGDCVLDSATGRVLARAPSLFLSYTRHGRILARDQLQNYSIHVLRNFQVGSELATPFASGEILCPHCLERISPTQADAGTDIECPDCGKRVRLNPFSYCDKYRPVSAIESPIPKLIFALTIGAAVWLLFERIWHRMGSSTPSLHGMALASLAAALYLIVALRTRKGRKTRKSLRGSF